MSGPKPAEPAPRAAPAATGAQIGAPGTAPHRPPDPREGDRSRSPDTSWIWWTAPLALLAGIALAAVASVLVDVPAIVLGANLSSSHTPGGLVIADTFVQDVAFVVVAVSFAKLGGRSVRSWQFGLRAPGQGWLFAVLMVLALIIAFIGLDAIWSEVFHPTKEKLLETLGTKESQSLLVLSAALTCVVAPIGEEMLFRGYMFTALRNWRGTLPAAVLVGLMFGAVHATSAPAADLVPLGALGFGLCMLYRYTGSLYPGIAAHALNNSIAFASLEGWNVAQGLVLIVCALGGIAVVAQACRLLGLISPTTGLSRPAA